LGVVYGDIGTSPLYTIKQQSNGRAAPSRRKKRRHVLADRLTLIIITIDQICRVIMRARTMTREGGILALMSLLGVNTSAAPRYRHRNAWRCAAVRRSMRSRRRSPFEALEGLKTLPDCALCRAAVRCRSHRLVQLVTGHGAHLEAFRPTHDVMVPIIGA
jgi:hypothetical protein